MIRRYHVLGNRSKSNPASSIPATAAFAAMTSAVTASPVALQQHYDEIMSHMPMLALSCGPSSFSDLGKAVTAGSGRQCQICSRRTAALGLVCRTRCDFVARTVRPTSAHWACNVCRALACPELLLQLAMPLPSSDASR